MTLRFFAALTLLIVSLTCRGGDVPDVSASPETRISMAGLEAADVAMKQFKEDQPKADSLHFYVVVVERADHFEVDFVPKQVPLEQGRDKDSQYIAVPSGSGNKHGRNIRYLVSKKDGAILKTIYPR
jgi:hypothetical protein